MGNVTPFSDVELGPTRRFGYGPRILRAHVLYSVTKLMTWTSKLDEDHLNPDALESALGWAQKALQLDPTSPQAHVQLCPLLQASA
jgi:hypothetical protein